MPEDMLLHGKLINDGGQTPYGYYIDKQQKLQIDEKAAPIVVDVFTMYAEGKTINKIVQYLNAKGLKTNY